MGDISKLHRFRSLFALGERLLRGIFLLGAALRRHCLVAVKTSLVTTPMQDRVRGITQNSCHDTSFCYAIFIEPVIRRLGTQLLPDPLPSWKDVIFFVWNAWLSRNHDMSIIVLSSGLLSRHSPLAESGRAHASESFSRRIWLGVGWKLSDYADNRLLPWQSWRGLCRWYTGVGFCPGLREISRSRTLLPWLSR